jgi:hypothetical protein
MITRASLRARGQAARGSRPASIYRTGTPTAHWISGLGYMAVVRRNGPVPSICARLSGPTRSLTVHGQFVDLEAGERNMASSPSAVQHHSSPRWGRYGTHHVIGCYMNLAMKRNRGFSVLRYAAPILLGTGKGVDRRVPELSDPFSDGTLFCIYLVDARNRSDDSFA